MSEGKLRKFAAPTFLSKASSPLSLPGEDPVRRPPKAMTWSVLQNGKFTLAVEKLANVHFLVKRVNLPGFSLGVATQATPFTDAPRPGDKIVFNPLTVTMALAEDFSNYLEIQRWTRALGFPESHREHKILEASDVPGVPRWGTTDTSDATVSIFSNGGAFEQARFTFKYLFPAFVDDIDMEASAGGEEVTFNVTFFYTTYDVEIVPAGEADA